MQITIVSSAALDAGLAALQEGRYPDAIAMLEAFCQDCVAHAQTSSRDYLRAQMHLVKVYDQQGQPDRAIALCRQLAHCANAPVQIWAQQHLRALTQSELLPVEQTGFNWRNFVAPWLSKLRQIGRQP